MNLFRVSAVFLLAGALGACTHDSTFIIAPDSVAGLRYVNLVPDTGAMDFRIIDVVSNAPNQVGATFRTGGAPSGVPTTLLPPYQAVASGSRHIRVFMNGTTAAVASTVMFDTTFTFASNNNYTLFLYGYSRTGSTPKLAALITKDSVPAIPAGQYAVRVVHLAPVMGATLPGVTTATANVDVFVDTLTAATTPVGAATFANVQFGEVRPYVTKVARPAVGGANPVPALAYRSAFSAQGTFTPFVASSLPAGVVGTSTTNPIAGYLTAGSAITVLLAPPSVAGSAATNFAAPVALYMIDAYPPRTAP